ncbi:hypothetical protein DPMN_076909, partial [Dreissena polymorpha]
MTPIHIVFVLASLCVLASATNRPCTYKGQNYRHDQTFIDVYSECKCNDGQVTCSQRVYGKKQCTYKEKTYQDGQTFIDVYSECTCNDGTVTCSQRAYA